MRPIAFISLIALAVCRFANAQCPDTAPYEKAREVIQDLERIVAPSGIQESYKGSTRRR